LLIRQYFRLMHGRNPPTFTPMDTTPTPRTDRSTPITDEDFSDLVEACNSPAAKRIEQLERELAEAQELLCQTSAEREHNGRMANECRMQRDMLAEALQSFINGWSDKSCDSIVTEQQFRDAKQALAAVKGEQP
jgi:hypothetical protein